MSNWHQAVTFFEHLKYMKCYPKDFLYIISFNNLKNLMSWLLPLLQVRNLRFREINNLPKLTLLPSLHPCT
jgi:hypothetical protein